MSHKPDNELPLLQVAPSSSSSTVASTTASNAQNIVTNRPRWEVQCDNCQGYGHYASTCHRKQRPVGVGRGSQQLPTTSKQVVNRDQPVNHNRNNSSEQRNDPRQQEQSTARESSRQLLKQMTGQQEVNNETLIGHIRTAPFKQSNYTRQQEQSTLSDRPQEQSTAGEGSRQPLKQSTPQREVNDEVSIGHICTAPFKQSSDSRQRGEAPRQLPKQATPQRELHNRVLPALTNTTSGRIPRQQEQSGSTSFGALEQLPAKSKQANNEAPMMSLRTASSKPPAINNTRQHHNPSTAGGASLRTSEQSHKTTAASKQPLTVSHTREQKQSTGSRAKVEGAAQQLPATSIEPKQKVNNQVMVSNYRSCTKSLANRPVINHTHPTDIHPTTCTPPKQQANNHNQTLTPRTRPPPFTQTYPLKHWRPKPPLTHHTKYQLQPRSTKPPSTLIPDIFPQVFKHFHLTLPLTTPHQTPDFSVDFRASKIYYEWHRQMTLFELVCKDSRPIVQRKRWEECWLTGRCGEAVLKNLGLVRRLDVRILQWWEEVRMGIREGAIGLWANNAANIDANIQNTRITLPSGFKLTNLPITLLRSPHLTLSGNFDQLFDRTPFSLHILNWGGGTTQWIPHNVNTVALNTRLANLTHLCFEGENLHLGPDFVFWLSLETTSNRLVTLCIGQITEYSGTGTDTFLHHTPRYHALKDLTITFLYNPRTLDIPIFITWFLKEIKPRQLDTLQIRYTSDYDFPLREDLFEEVGKEVGRLVKGRKGGDWFSCDLPGCEVDG